MEMMVLVLRGFLALILVTAAIGKRGAPGPIVADYDVWSPGLWRVVMALLAPLEIAVALAVVLSPDLGLLLGGALFVVFGHAQAAALALGYRGWCGCTGAESRVSILGAARAYAWGVGALWVGAGQVTGGPWSGLAVALGLAVAIMVVLGVVALLAPGPRLRRARTV